MRRPGLILVLWVLLLALCAWPFAVRAEGFVSAQSASVSYCWYGSMWGSACGPAGGNYASAAAVRDADVASARASNASCNYSYSGYSETATSASWTLSTSVCAPVGGRGAARQTNNLPAGCPSNSVLSGGMCLCAAGYLPNASATACVVSSSGTSEFCLAIRNALNENPDPRQVSDTFTSTPTPTTCLTVSGCPMQGMMAALNVSGLSFTVWGPWVNSADCAAAAAGQGTPTGPVCAAGTVAGTVNGLPVCVPSSTTTTTDRSVTTTPAGSASAPSGVSAGSSTSSTTCTGSQCTTTTTIRDGSGVVTGTTVSSGSKDGFCEQNPETSICKSSSVEAACAGGVASVACDGDAIQCQIAREQFVRNCQLFEGTHETRTVSEAALAGDPDPSHPGHPDNVSSIAIDSMIDTDAIIGAGSCPSDVGYSIPILGTMVVPWSRMCSWLQLMGTILVAAAGVTWLFIVFGSKGV